MGFVHADIQLTNEDDLAAQRRGQTVVRVRTGSVHALVDTGALNLVLTTVCSRCWNCQCFGVNGC